MRNYLTGLVFATCAFATSTANAEDVPFTINIPGECTLSVTDGRFGIDSDRTILSSEHGADGIVRVTANSNLFAVQISDVPDNFTNQPSGANITPGQMTFTASYTYLNQTRRVSTLRHQVMPGTSNMLVRLVADYSGAFYPPGAYRAVAEVTCEAFDPEMPGNNIVTLGS